jgi:translation initiation factor 1 (eIF-1/SUI1)
MITNNEKDTRVSRLVTDPRIARKLLKKGFVVIDIKPNKSNPDKSVFIFENTEEFKIALEEVTAEVKAKEEVKEEPVEMAD